MVCHQLQLKGTEAIPKSIHQKRVVWELSNRSKRKLLPKKKKRLHGLYIPHEPEEPEEERDPEAPILELTDDHIFLKVGDHFNYMSYIKTMEDVDGSDLSHYIYLDKDVDTSEPGEIELTYRITSVITGKSDSKVLLITIRE